MKTSDIKDEIDWLKCYAEDGRNCVFLEVTIPAHGIEFSVSDAPGDLIPLAKIFQELGWEVGVGT